MDPHDFLNKFFFHCYFPRLYSVSLWQAALSVSAGFALWNMTRLFKSLPGRPRLLLAGIFILGAAFRLSLSPRNIFETNYRSLDRLGMVSHGFHEEYSLDDIRNSHQYYFGYGQAEFWKCLVADPEKASLQDVFLIDGAASILDILLIFFAAWLIFADTESALWSALLLALFPIHIRLSFGDSVYSFGTTLILLSLIHFILFFKSGSAAALLPALGFAYCLLYTHIAFLPFPLIVPFFYPLSGRKWRDLGQLLGWTNISLLVLFLALAAPAYALSLIHYSKILMDVHLLDRPLWYLQGLVHFLTHRTDSFLNRDADPAAFIVLFFLGLAALLIRDRVALAAIAASIALLSLPIFPAMASQPNPGYCVNLVKQDHTMFLFLLAAAFGLRQGVDFLARWRSKRVIVAAASAILIAQPLLCHDFIAREYNYQREISFLRRQRSRHDFGRYIFTLPGGRARLDAFCPGRYELRTISYSSSQNGTTAAPADYEPALRFLDSLLIRKLTPVFYLSYDCYYRHPGDFSVRQDAVLRDDCARFLRNYELKPIAEETFKSDIYDWESDNTDADRIKLGFYRILPKPGRKTSGAAKAEALAAEGISLFSAGRRREAEAAFRKALSFDPGSVDAGLSLATVLAVSGRSAQAARCYDAILARLASDDQDRRADVLSARANVMDRLGRPERARRDRLLALQSASPTWRWRQDLQAALSRPAAR
jgi:tetratricopeptide (TPR) repeat protein